MESDNEGMHMAPKNRFLLEIGHFTWSSPELVYVAQDMYHLKNPRYHFLEAAMVWTNSVATGFWFLRVTREPNLQTKTFCLGDENDKWLNLKRSFGQTYTYSSNHRTKEVEGT